MLLNTCYLGKSAEEKFFSNERALVGEGMRLGGAKPPVRPIVSRSIGEIPCRRRILAMAVQNGDVS